ncbi:TPA: hypothetical protein ACY3HI_004738 [Citrobacter braakii]
MTGLLFCGNVHAEIYRCTWGLNQTGAVTWEGYSFPSDTGFMVNINSVANTFAISATNAQADNLQNVLNTLLGKMHLLIFMQVYDTKYSQASDMFSAVAPAITGTPVAYDNRVPSKGGGYGGALSATHAGNASWRISLSAPALPQITVSSDIYINFDDEWSPYDKTPHDIDLPVTPESIYQDSIITIKGGTVPSMTVTFTPDYLWSKAPSGTQQSHRAIPLNNSLTCIRNKTPVSLVVTPGELNFGIIPVSDITPVVRTVSWSVAGASQADNWTITIDGAADSTEGHYFLLGAGRVEIRDSENNIMTPGVSENAQGGSGIYTLTLYPAGASVGEFSGILNFTMSAK